MPIVNLVLITLALENKEIFDHENSQKFNVSLKGNLKRNIVYWQNTLMANESVLHITKNGYKIPFL